MCREGVEQSGREKLHAGDQGSGDIWQLHPARGYERGVVYADRTTGVAGGGGSSGLWKCT